jgi:hypothetical protein
MVLRIEALARRHKPLLSKFENQHPSLTEYVRRYALRHQEKDLLARTFLAIQPSGSDERVAGYFTLTTTSVERRSVSIVESLQRLPQVFSWRGSQSIVECRDGASGHISCVRLWG